MAGANTELNKGVVEVDPAVAAAAADDAEFGKGFDEASGKVPQKPVLTKEGVAATAAPQAGVPAQAPATGAVPSQQSPATGAAPANPDGKPGGGKEPTHEQNQVEPGEESVTINKRTLDRILYAADLAVSMKGNLEKLNGTVGSQAAEIKKLTGAPSLDIEITDAEFAELAKDFPEVAAGTKKALQAILKKLGVRQTPQGLTIEQLQSAVSQRTIELEVEALEDAYPNWRQIVGLPTDKDNKFRKWLATQPAAYAERVTKTFSSQVLARAIQRFLASEKPAASPTLSKPATLGPGARGTMRTTARNDRLRQAVQPRGDGGATPSRQPTEDDEFQAGFKSG